MSSQPFRLDGKIALVTGGASGIGEQITRVFTAAGASVIISDVNREKAEALAASLPGGRAIACDITNEDAVAAAFLPLDQLDILVNNAGIGLVGNVAETELADFQRIFRVNVEGLFLMTKHALPLLLASHGSIVNLGSVAGLVGVKRRFGYCATKGAVVAITRNSPSTTRRNCASIASAPAPSTRPSSKATSRSTTRTRRRKCAPN